MNKIESFQQLMELTTNQVYSEQYMNEGIMIISGGNEYLLSKDVLSTTDDNNLLAFNEVYLNGIEEPELFFELKKLYK
ncbi:MAG: hypothetical protein RR543_00625 [Erysipelotrichales bacterium]